MLQRTLHCNAGASSRPMARRASSSNGASGSSSEPRTPPEFLIAVRTSSSVSSLRGAMFCNFWWVVKARVW